jgi:hypothetical protein
MMREVTKWYVASGILPRSLNPIINQHLTNAAVKATVHHAPCVKTPYEGGVGFLHEMKNHLSAQTP